MRLVFFLALLLVPRLVVASTDASSTNAPAPTPPRAASTGKLSKSAQTAQQLQAALDQLTKSNRDLLDLLKQQQAVLQDMEFEHRQQGRQITSLEERLTDALQENTQLQTKVATLEAEAAVRPAGAPEPPPVSAPAAMAPVAAAPPTNAAPVIEQPPPPPESYLPPADSDGPPGTKSWHRLFTLKGEDGKKTDLFPIQGHVWRVVWHNQDKPGDHFKNTSGLFINAFPKDDTIPQRVCGKVGTATDSTQLQGPGNYYLQIDASGGSWELAVEDYH